jgi:anti-sigma-K factor RskA
MTYNDQETVQEPTAAEYVLGTLEGDERSRFEQRLKSDMGLQAEVTAWEERLNPMLDAVDTVQPPPGVWHQIQQRIEPEAEKSGLWNSLGFWRNLGMVAATLVLGLGLTIFGIQSDPELDRVLMVTNHESKVEWVVGNSGNDNLLQVKAVAPPQLPEGKVCQLWMETLDGTLRPVGVMPHSGIRSMQAPANLNQSRSFKISIESEHNLPTDKPTGKFVFEGELIQI